MAVDPVAGRILMVCTGNECRSAAAEALLRTELGPWAQEYELWSAGTQAQDGAPIHSLTARALAAYSAAPRRHRARLLLRQDLEGADLVLCATRQHRVAAVQLDPTAVRRTFTMAEFARLAPLLEERHDVQGFHRLVDAASSVRGAVRPINAVDDDLPDPVWGDEQLHAAVVGRIASLMSQVGLLLTRAGAPTPSGR